MRNIVDEIMPPEAKLVFDIRISQMILSLMDLQDMISRHGTVSVEHAREDVDNLNRKLSRACTIRDFALITRPVVRSINQVLNEVEELENYE